MDEDELGFSREPEFQAPNSRFHVFEFGFSLIERDSQLTLPEVDSCKCLGPLLSAEHQVSPRRGPRVPRYQMVRRSRPKKRNDEQRINNSQGGQHHYPAARVRGPTKHLGAANIWKQGPLAAHHSIVCCASSSRDEARSRPDARPGGVVGRPLTERARVSI